MDDLRATLIDALGYYDMAEWYREDIVDRLLPHIQAERTGKDAEREAALRALVPPDGYTDGDF